MSYRFTVSSSVKVSAFVDNFFIQKSIQPEQKAGSVFAESQATWSNPPEL
jgi:hypothetical protein